MSKDELDKHTVDGLPKKRGRPVLNREKGPMSIADRLKRHRAGKKVVQFRLSPTDHHLLKTICSDKETNKDDLIKKWIRNEHKKK